ncbi:Adaptor-related protein complex 5 [Mactra antiquata]
MMCYFDDTDVQDKARFYYALVTGSTDSKVQSVLTTNLKDVESMNQTITSLLPGSIDKMTLAKIIKMEQPIFKWNRISISARKNNVQVTNEMTHGLLDDDGDKTGDVVDLYEKFVAKLDVILEIKCSIQLRDDKELDRIHAVSIHTESLLDYQPLHNKHIACLTGNETRDVILLLRPKLPLPRTVHCSAIFATDSKLTYSSVLTTFPIAFSDLMMPLPWKQTDGPKLIFSEIWEWVLTRKVDDRGGIESVKIFHLTKQQFTGIHESKLKCFHYMSNTGSDDTCFAIFMPPSYHILMKCVISCDDHIVVTMVTDLQTLLPHINQFLEEVFR